MLYHLYRHISPYAKLLVQNLGLSVGSCRFSPTCSLYAKEAIAIHGLAYGCWLALIRVIQCHPWSKGGYDPVPQPKY